MRISLRTSVRLAGLLAGIAGTGLHAQTIGAPYASSYTYTDLGSVTGIPTNYGGLSFLAGDNNTLLLGGSANSAAGYVYSVPVHRDLAGHIISFDPATQFARAPFIDGGLTYGPGGVLFYTGWPNNTLGEIKPGSAGPDKTITLPSATSSVGSVAFVPDGFTGAGQFKLLSFNNSSVFGAILTADGSGTYDVSSLTFRAALSGGLEGLAYVPLGSAAFAGENALIAEYSNGSVAAYQVDANGDPIAGTRQTFLSGLTGAEGAVIDPVTGDFLFSTFGGGNRVSRVSGFAAPTPTVTPEPASLLLMATGLVGLAGVRRRRSSPR